jgi:hypothetical protein
MHRLRRAAACAVLSLGASLLAVDASATQPTSSLVLELRPTSEAALQSLLAAPRLAPADRARRVRALVPGASRHRTVARAAEALGLRVVRTSAWSMRVQGPSTSVTRLFGRLTAHGPGAAGRAYPLMPAALDPYVVAALPTSGRVASPLAIASPRQGADFRTAYSAPTGSTGTGLAVATVQLSGWTSTDLDTYAKHHNITGFDSHKQYVARPISYASTTKPDGQGGDEEVALDQEAILVTAPGATQVAYFAPNDDGGDGYVAAIRAVGDEAATYHTAALSLSWGGCEASDDRRWLAAMDSALKLTLAAGVTIFAASGDQGSQDCIGEIPGGAQFAPAVDYPASSPYAVAVGGTTLPPPGSTNPPAGWSGSGGGESTYEWLPSWQSGVASNGPNNNRRLVPDIASDADPNNGLCVYESTTAEPPSQACSNGEFMLAGTSLASPTQAALLVDTLAAAGVQNGVGDIHSALYAGAPSGAVTDVTTDSDKGGNGSYHSRPGFDLVTGLGTPVWTSLQSWLGQFDVGAPRGTRTTSFAIHPVLPATSVTYSAWSALLTDAPADCTSATSSSPPTSAQLATDAPDGTYRFWVAGVSGTPAADSCHIGTASVVLDRKSPRAALSVAVSGSGVATARWSFSDPSPSSGLQKFVVVATSAGAVRWSLTTTARSRTFGVLPRSRWNLRVTAYDNAGNAASATAHVYDDSSAFTYSSGWKRVTAALAYRHSFALATRVGAYARVSATARRFVVYLTRCPACGKVAVFDAHGRRVATIDTYSPRTRYHVGTTLQSLAHAAKRTFFVRVLSSKNARSRGRDVGLDAFSFA